jgi:molybdopterin synthase sulfur carrier subunit
MPVVWIPPLLRGLTGGQEELTVPGETVRQVIEHLEEAYPGIKARLLEDDRLRPTLSIVVDGRLSPLKLRQPLTDTSEVHFVPAVSGG